MKPAAITSSRPKRPPQPDPRTTGTQILNIHMQQMRDAGGLSKSAVAMVDSGALAQRTEYFSGAEVREG